MIPRLTKDFHLRADGRSYIGLIQDFTSPKIAFDTVDINNGGMGGTVEAAMKLQKMEASWTANEHNASMIGLFGITELEGLLLRVSEAVESNAPGATTEAVEYQLRGFVKEMDDGTTEVNKKNEHKYTMSVTYYNKLVNGVSVIEIDFINYVYKVNGVDMFAGRRTALGI